MGNRIQSKQLQEKVYCNEVNTFYNYVKKSIVITTYISKVNKLYTECTASVVLSLLNIV